MTYVCPDCGAVDTGNGTCRELFESFLVLEFVDPSYGEVHFFTVGTYMIQHYRYSPFALKWICRAMRDVLDGKYTIQEIRQELGSQADSNGIVILHKPDDPLLPRVRWQMTIADVAEQYDGAHGYCNLIRLWADTTLRQLS